MAKGKADGLRNLIADNLPKRSRPRWEDRIPSDVMDVLIAVRDDFLAGKLGEGVTKTGLATSIHKSLRDECAIDVCHHTVVRWIEKT